MRKTNPMTWFHQKKKISGDESVPETFNTQTNKKRLSLGCRKATEKQ